VILYLAVFSSRTAPQTGSLYIVFGLDLAGRLCLQPFMVSGGGGGKQMLRLYGRFLVVDGACGVTA
jgi:hypothetical protein